MPKPKWTVVDEDGHSITFEGTLEQLLGYWARNMVGQPLAIIRNTDTVMKGWGNGTQEPINQ